MDLGVIDMTDEEKETPKIYLSATEKETLSDVLQEGGQLAQTNAALDIQKQEVMKRLMSNAEAYQRLMAKVQKRFGIPDGSRVDVDAETGVLRMSGPRMMMGGPPG